MRQETGLARRIDRELRQQSSAVSVTYLNRRGRMLECFAAERLSAEAVTRAGALEQRFPPGSRLLMVMPPGPEFLLTFLGCLYAGMIAIPVPDPMLGNSFERLDAIHHDAEPAGVLCTSSNATLLDGHLRSLSTRSVLVTMDGPEDRAEVGAARCEGLHQANDVTVLIQYTSGSVRSPKGVALSGKNIVSNSVQVSQNWDLNHDRRHLLVNWLPHFHDMGLMGGLLYPILMGGPSVQLSPLAFLQHPINWLRAMSEHRATISGGPAFAYKLCLQAVRDEDLLGLDLSSWDTAFCGAEPVPAALLEAFRMRFRSVGLRPGAVYASYGLAEATLFVAGLPGRPVEAEPEAVQGSALEPCRMTAAMRENLCIVDPETRLPMPDGTRGEIWVKGDSVAQGYVSSGVDSESAAAFCAELANAPGQQFFRTGDLGWVGPAGLHISGRKKDVLIANGANIAAVDVEWTAAKVDGNLNGLGAAAVSLALDGPDEVALLIEVNTQSSMLEDPALIASRIRRTVRAEYGIELQRVVFVKRGCLERTTSGKVRRQTVAQRLREGFQYPEAAQ